MAFLEKYIIKILESAAGKFSSKKEPGPSGSFYLGKAHTLYDRNKHESIYLSPREKENHVYAVGATCTGKSTFLEHMIRQHIRASEGFALFDLHGDLSEQIKRYLAYLFMGKNSAEKRNFAEKIVLIEPFHLDSVVSFNPLEVREKEKMFFTVLELVEVFRNRWADFWGPRTDELLRNTLLILAENDLTLLEAPALLLNNRFRKSLASSVESEETRSWLYRYNKLTEPQKTVYRDPSLNKISEFLGDKTTRCLLGQQASSIDFRTAIDRGKWMIFNIPKGRLKSSAFLLASLFLCKLQLAALSRADISYADRKPFYIFADEFQSLATKEVSAMEIILSESRKYKVFLRMAHQNIHQIDKKLTEAILGNAKMLLVFQVSHNDARVLSPEINPGAKEFLNKQIIDLGIGEAFFKMKGKPHRLLSLPLPEEKDVPEEAVEELTELSFSFYTKPSSEIESDIRERHRKLGLIKERSGTEAAREDEADEW